MLFQHNKVNYHHRPRSLKRQEGVVIVVALFIVALVATMAYLMMARLERDTRRVSLILHDVQAEFYAQGSVAWAIDQLQNNIERNKHHPIVDVMPMQSPEKIENGYHIISTIYDMQSRYNLNNLSLPDEAANFKRMLQALVPMLTEQQAQYLIEAMIDWITPGDKQKEFSKYYLALPKPYRQPHKPMLSVSELHLIKGITPDIFNALQAYVIALPPPTTINVQTACAPLFMALGSTITLETGKRLEQQREATPITSIQSFLNWDIVKNHPVTADKLTTLSTYFLVETKVIIENQHIVLYTLLERKTSAQKPSINIVWQSKGIW